MSKHAPSPDRFSIERIEEEFVKIVKLMKRPNLDVLLSGFNSRPSILNRWYKFEQLSSRVILTTLKELDLMWGYICIHYIVSETGFLLCM